MKRRSLYFSSPGCISIATEDLPEPRQGQLLVQSLLSAISGGTELLIYRGQFPEDLAVDETIEALGGTFAYPLKYGYSLVGQVTAAGPGVDPAWVGRLVFTFHPHESHFLAAPGDLQPLPQGIPPEAALFLPNMETAVNFLMDGAPLLGERVMVFGQGVVGLLTTSLLGRFPLGDLITIEQFLPRRQASVEAGARASFAPEELGEARARLEDGADLVYELSGSPLALDAAIQLTGFSGRVVIGSWYGQKRASLDLGGRFHRSRIRLIASQVSSLAPELSGRWNKQRRFQTAWELLRQVQPQRWITQRIPFDQAGEAYRLLDQRPEEAIQVVLEYQ